MLQSLHIQNYALIDTLDIEFTRGFSVITGETGAGKSIILGAIALLLGQRADKSSIKTGESRCVIEATFNLKNYAMDDFFNQADLDFDGEECIIRREISASGKSRAFINDTPASLSLLKDLGCMLIDVHSQHQNLMLGKEDFQLNVVDIIAHNDDVRKQYSALYSNYKACVKALHEAIDYAAQVSQEQDYLSFQLEQIEEAKLEADEQENIESELETLSHTEEIKSTLYATASSLNGDEGGVVERIKEAKRNMAKIASYFPAGEQLVERLESCFIEMKDIADELESENDNIEYNPARQEYLDDRLNTIYNLEQKHHVNSIQALLDMAMGWRNKLNSIDHSEARIEELEQEVKEAQNLMLNMATTLTATRRKAAEIIEQEMQNKLVPLGIPNVKFHIDITAKKEADATGIDKIEFLFSANKNAQLQPISEVASGGEIARVMLSIKAMISCAVNLPTIIFDEVDTGVSGSIAEKMALIMKEMGENGHRQVISITHLPQIAAVGRQHYKVYKEDNEKGTSSHIIPLDYEARVEEIAHMLSGATLTEAAITNAKDLLKQWSPKPQ